MKTITKLIHFGFASLALGCFALSPTARAVVPPPDGGYPNLTTAEGDNALKALTTGVGNTAVGTFSLFSVSTGNFSTGLGAGALTLNTADSNTGVGTAALLHNVSGGSNTAVGAFAGFNISGSSANVTVGTGSTTSGLGITTGSGNTVVGDQAGLGISSANNDTIIGNSAGGNPLVLNDCIYIGHNVGTGFSALESNTIRIGDNLPTVAGASQCFIGGILSHMVPISSGTPVVTIDTSTGQLGFGPDFLSKVVEQQKKIEEQQASINQLKSEMQTMVAQLKEQAAQIQKVSAQLELSKRAPQTVLNNR